MATEAGKGLGRAGGNRIVAGLVLGVCIMLTTGCIATRSEVRGKFAAAGERNRAADKVTVFFDIRPTQQQHGFDSIPKIRPYVVKDFDDLFRNALGELSNIASYDSFTESPHDVNAPKRRKELAEFRTSHDYTIEVTLFEESSFRQQCLSATISILSLTVIPMPYSWDYTITANLSDRSGTLLRTYQRSATLDNWVEALLIFAYPFYPLEGAREEIYAEALRDIFRQIEAERVLQKPTAAPVTPPAAPAGSPASRSGA